MGNVGCKADFHQALKKLPLAFPSGVWYFQVKGLGLQEQGDLKWNTFVLPGS